MPTIEDQRLVKRVTVYHINGSMQQLMFMAHVQYHYVLSIHEFSYILKGRETGEGLEPLRFSLLSVSLL
ncbi:hypothetical protein AB205_0084770 [Aquarana catesbeiana]|uniref:Uncharacterized protein n=1 Tax=Aquarana catesbeiana TaxID=8400 RepID=A0A2G9RXA7_AQUCT|nr:hypothetical protein AB205_0084770 [Aquarana catesbeiana]